MSNIAPHSSSSFSNQVHLVRKDIIFAPPGAHIFIMWSKTLQGYKDYKFIQIPSLQDENLCPVLALRRLLASRPLTAEKPLFALNYPPFHSVIDTKIRYSLRSVLTSLQISVGSHGFHAFRRSGAVAAYGANASVEDIKAHSNWKSDAIYSYLRSDIAAPLGSPQLSSLSSSGVGFGGICLPLADCICVYLP